MNTLVEPRLSLVIPTTGTDGSVLRLLKTVVNFAPRKMLGTTEVVVYLNKHPLVEVDIDAIIKYLDEVRVLFHSVHFQLSDTLHLTAEASALGAAGFATGEYLWLAGDKRIFLPEGLQQLARYLEAPPAPCAYFNAVKQERDGYTNMSASTFFTKSVATLSYKQLVQKMGVNFMPTNMGTWVFKRSYLDLAMWKQVMTECGPHFSHVTSLLVTMGSEPVVCYSVYLTILELKPYHGGDAGEWVKYAEFAKSYRFFPWTFGLVRQFRFLISQGTYTYMDVRRSMCSESGHYRRQIDETCVHFHAQIQLGWQEEKERMTQAEFDEIWSFLVLACPERTVINGLLAKLYASSLKDPAREAYRRSRPVLQAIALDYDGVRFGSLIVGQVGDRFIRLHPDGYLLSPVTDNEAFLLAYRLIDVPVHHELWQIIQDEELYTLALEKPVNDPNALMPGPVDRSLTRYVPKERKYQRITRKLFGSRFLNSMEGFLAKHFKR